MYDDEVQVPTAPPQPGLDDELDPLLGSWPILGIPFGNIFDVVLVDVAADAKGIDAINIIPDGVCLRGHFQRNMIMCLRSCWQQQLCCLLDLCLRGLGLSLRDGASEDRLFVLIFILSALEDVSLGATALGTGSGEGSCSWLRAWACSWSSTSVSVSRIGARAGTFLLRWPFLDEC